MTGGDSSASPPQTGEEDPSESVAETTRGPTGKATRLPAGAEEDTASREETLTLEQREARWGFTLTELQHATRVVSTLFHNPALFVGDPYLAESRLYTMITRDRKKKKENYEVYRKIMNEEKSRRKRYQRMQDAEAVRKTTMKREREETLNALLLEDGRDAPPLLLCDTLASKNAMNDANEEVAETGRREDASGWSDAQKMLFRLVGAYENITRLEAAITAQRYPEEFLPGSFSRVPRSPTSPYSPAARETGATETPKGTIVSSSAAPDHVQALAVSQLTAQVYRYMPHAFGTQMPPPLFPGPVPPNVSAVEQQAYLIWHKLQIAHKAELVAPLNKPESPSGVPLPNGLREVLRSNRDAVVLSRRLPLMREANAVSALRAWMASVCEAGEGESAALSGSDAESVREWYDSVYEQVDSSQWLLRQLELELLEGGEAPCFHTSVPAANSDNSSSSTLACLTPFDSACATLDLFIIRRLYSVPAVWQAGASPVVIDTAPPTSDSQEPDRYSVYDDLQVYAYETAAEESLRVSKWLSCHTCKVRYRLLHPYYYSMCHLCGEYNYNKRLMTADLRGKNVLLTGCRIKIGFAMALSLLRCGATLLGTTRFAHEALARFQAESDYEVWKDRLHLFSLDLRDMWVTTQFCFFVRQRFQKLYAIINNAAQTISRTPSYTEKLRALESAPPPALKASLDANNRAAEWHDFFLRHTSVHVGIPLALDDSSRSMAAEAPKAILPAPHEGTEVDVPPSPSSRVFSAAARPHGSSALAPVTVGLAAGTGEVALFDRYDTLAEESDCRETNSWMMKLGEVNGSEAAEVMAINALSPFIINSRLKPCLLNREGDDRPDEPRFVINVSAMEGQFYRYKQPTHPHTNMAKAALNMMSRTSGEDYAADGIYMNSVDTGWITDESPKEKKQRRAEQMMLCPLDEVDAAARCLELIYTKSRVYGKFYKNYGEIPW